MPSARSLALIALAGACLLADVPGPHVSLIAGQPTPAAPPAWATLMRPAGAPAIEVPAFDRILTQLGTGVRRRVLVRVAAPRALAEGFQPEALLGAQSVGRQRALLASQQRAALGQVRAATAARATLFDIVPVVALDVDEDEFLALVASPDVERIEEDLVLAPVLAQSIALIGGDVNGTFGGHTGSGGTVAIIDTGVDASHAFFGGRVVSEACYSTTISGTAESVCPGGVTSSTAAGSGAACASNVTGCDHGTHVAGIAAGNGPNFTGVAKDASIIAIQVFSKFLTSGSCGSLAAPCALSYTSNLMSGLQRVYALRDTYPIGAVNVSIGGGVYTAACDGTNTALKSVIDSLRAVGIATIIASGNGGSSSGVSAPACISSAVTVGSTTKADAVSSFSNSSPLVELLAPGSSIASSVLNGAYAYKSGTSMAAPHVAGAWTVARAKKPTATVNEVLQAFTMTGTTVVDGRNGVGVPRINVTTALSHIASTAWTLLWRHTDGRLLTWTQSGTWSLGSASLNNGAPLPTVWTYGGTGDFSGDGKPDHVWRHADGRVAIWYMDGATQTGAALANNGVAVPLFWRLSGVDDFDGDGKADLLWRHTDGRAAVWFMDGLVTSSTALLDGGVATPAVWTIAGTSDFNGDGRADVLWRHTEGRVAVWYMNGATRLGTALIHGGQNVPAVWTLSATFDLNGDLHPDLLWRHSDGRIAVWFMNGVTRASSSFLNNGAPVGTAWRLTAAY